MSIGTIVSLILAILKFLPWAKSVIDEIIAGLVAARIAEMKAANRTAIKVLIEKQDQRDAERALGSPRAGEPSGIPGSEIRDRLPGVDE